MVKSKERVVEFNDVALREGAQVEGGSLNPRDQMTYVRYLVEGGINRIEVGYPGSSPEQKENCIKIMDFVSGLSGKKKPLLSGLATADKAMIDAVKKVGCDICHIYIPSSEEFIKSMFNARKYGDTLEGKQQWVINQSVAMVKYAKELGFKHIEYSPEDAARSSREYICCLVEAVIDAGATIINIPDTTGLRILNEFGQLITYIKENVRNIDQVKLSVHCHNDSDSASSNALWAIKAGVDIVEGTFYGLGERSGMTKFESVLMAVTSRRDIFDDIRINFDIGKCVRIVNFIANALGMPVPRHWPVVGVQNAICSSGTHQAIEDRAENPEYGYYSWDPKKYGHDRIEIVINQSSGRAGIKKRLRELGYRLGPEELKKIYELAMNMSDAKGGGAITSRELVAVVQDALTEIPFPIKIKQSQVIGGTGTIPTATITAELNGDKVTRSETGNGPFNAIMKAVSEIAIHYCAELKDMEIMLDKWHPWQVTEGSESLADVYCRIRLGNGEEAVFAGRSTHPDSIQATAQSIANCFGWCIDWICNKD